ncbi:MAG: hypothetical protein P8Z30_06415 [Acidobacteriota bacterium]
MSKNRSGAPVTALSRRAFMELAGSSLTPFALPMVGYSLSADPPKTESKSSAANTQALTPYEDSFFYGRRYFIIRSGWATMILQADHADLGPALTYLLFNAEIPGQSRRKSGAFNFVGSEGASASALQVELGGYLFSALGKRTHTRWISEGGIPTVEAVWWAGGIRVTEQFSGLTKPGLFQRVIRLEGANLMGPQPASVRLSLPAGKFVGQGSVLVWNSKECQLGLIVHGNAPVESNVVRGYVDIGPFNTDPHAAIEVHTSLLVQAPARDSNEMVDRTATLVSTSAASERLATKKMWSETSQITTGDSTIQDLYDHARYSLSGMIADDGSMDAGIFEYGAQWARDTSNSALGAVHAGLFDSARAALENVLANMVSEQGRTMVASRFTPPEFEELDQMGEILHALKAYRDWTGDESLLQEHRTKIVNLIERPLSSQFRDATGMVHDRREYWERTFEDAYELAYQIYLIQGLRDAADLAPVLRAEEHADRWRKQAGETLQGLLHHPNMALVDNGHLIKRRNVTGQIANAIPASSAGLPGAPLCTESYHRLMPDSSMALPIALGIIDPGSPIAASTLDQLEQLWNTRWSDGGYDRYNTSSQMDQPGPWPFATCFILRAQHDSKQYERSRRTLKWMNTVQGAKSGCWFEEIPSTRSQEPYAGLIPWTCGEVTLFVIRHWLGVQFREGNTVIRPNLYPGSARVSADLRLRKGTLHLEISGSGRVAHALVNRRKVRPAADGSVVLPRTFTSGTVEIFAQQKR